jgi:hypothetical protein
MRKMDLPEDDHKHPEPKGPDYAGIIEFQDQLIRELRSLVDSLERKCAAAEYRAAQFYQQFMQRSGNQQAGQIVGATFQEQQALYHQSLAAQQHQNAQQQAQAVINEGRAWNGMAAQQAAAPGASSAPHLSMQNNIAQSLFRR